MYKRITAMLLCLLMAGTCFSCSSDLPAEDQPETDSAAITTETEPETEPPTPLMMLEKKNFGGAVYTIVDGNDYQDTYQNLPTNGLNGETVNDALYNRGKYVEENFAVSLRYEVMKKSEAINKTKSSVQAGEKNCDLLISGLSGALDTLATSNILANIASYDDLSLDSPWWSSLMNEQLCLDDRIYMTSGDIVLTMYSTPCCVFLNSTLLKDHKLEKDYYSIVSEGKWTWDTLEEITAAYNRDLNGDNTIKAEDDFLGLAYLKNNVATCAAITGSGVHLNTMEDQKIKLDLASERLISVVEKMKGVFLPISYSDANACLYTFMEDRAIALIHTAASGKNWFRDMNSDYMILPIPKFDETQETYYSFANTYTPAYVGIPLTAKEESTGFITEVLARYSYENIRPEFYNLILKQKGARDERSGEMLDIIFESIYLDFNCVYDFGGTRTLLKSVLFDGAELVSSIASKQSAADAAVAKFMESWTKN